MPVLVAAGRFLFFPMIRVEAGFPFLANASFEVLFCSLELFWLMFGLFMNRSQTLSSVERTGAERCLFCAVDVLQNHFSDRSVWL